MRLARRTFNGAFHHGMNRGYERRTIFRDERDRRAFLEILEKAQRLIQVRLLAYCVMGNHYHIVLQNTTGRMPMISIPAPAAGCTSAGMTPVAALIRHSWKNCSGRRRS
ncbi:MAG: transposase [Candidatus Aminicenantes bacterium]|nr:transposase [Candidatus Aminicenantes bacterium]